MAALIGGCRGRPMSSRARLGRSRGKLGAAAGVGGILRKAGQLFLRREGRRFKTLFPLEQAEPISPTGGIAGGRIFPDYTLSVLLVQIILIGR